MSSSESTSTMPAAPAIEEWYSDYPEGKETIFRTTRPIHDNDHEISIEFRVWDPAPFSENYLFPVANIDNGDTPWMINTDIPEGAWVQPFELSIFNTTKGNGDARGYVCTGFYSDSVDQHEHGLSYDMDRGLGVVTDKEFYGYGSPNWLYHRQLDAERTRVVAFIYQDGSFEQNVEYVDADFLLGEGEWVTLYGYFQIINAKDAPETTDENELLSHVYVGVSGDRAVCEIEKAAEVYMDTQGELALR